MREAFNFIGEDGISGVPGNLWEMLTAASDTPDKTIKLTSMIESAIEGGMSPDDAEVFAGKASTLMYQMGKPLTPNDFRTIRFETPGGKKVNFINDIYTGPLSRGLPEPGIDQDPLGHAIDVAGSTLYGAPIELGMKIAGIEPEENHATGPTPLSYRGTGSMAGLANDVGQVLGGVAGLSTGASKIAGGAGALFRMGDKLRRTRDIGGFGAIMGLQPAEDLEERGINILKGLGIGVGLNALPMGLIKLAEMKFGGSGALAMQTWLQTPAGRIAMGTGTFGLLAKFEGADNYETMVSMLAGGALGLKHSTAGGMPKVAPMRGGRGSAVVPEMTPTARADATLWRGEVPWPEMVSGTSRPQPSAEVSLPRPIRGEWKSGELQDSRVRTPQQMLTENVETIYREPAKPAEPAQRVIPIEQPVEAMRKHLGTRRSAAMDEAVKARLTGDEARLKAARAEADIADAELAKLPAEQRPKDVYDKAMEGILWANHGRSTQQVVDNLVQSGPAGLPGMTPETWAQMQGKPQIESIRPPTAPTTKAGRLEAMSQISARMKGELAEKQADEIGRVRDEMDLGARREPKEENLYDRVSPEEVDAIANPYIEEVMHQASRTKEGKKAGKDVARDTSFGMAGGNELQRLYDGMADPVKRAIDRTVERVHGQKESIAALRAGTAAAVMRNPSAKAANEYLKTGEISDLVRLASDVATGAGAFETKRLATIYALEAKLQERGIEKAPSTAVEKMQSLAARQAGKLPTEETVLAEELAAVRPHFKGDYYIHKAQVQNRIVALQEMGGGLLGARNVLDAEILRPNEIVELAKFDWLDKTGPRVAKEVLKDNNIKFDSKQDIAATEVTRLLSSSDAIIPPSILMERPEIAAILGGMPNARGVIEAAKSARRYFDSALKAANQVREALGLEPIAHRDLYVTDMPFQYSRNPMLHPVQTGKAVAQSYRGHTGPGGTNAPGESGGIVMQAVNPSRRYKSGADFEKETRLSRILEEYTHRTSNELFDNLAMQNNIGIARAIRDGSDGKLSNISTTIENYTNDVYAGKKWGLAGGLNRLGGAHGSIRVLRDFALTPLRRALNDAAFTLNIPWMMRTQWLSTGGAAARAGYFNLARAIPLARDPVFRKFVRENVYGYISKQRRGSLISTQDVGGEPLQGMSNRGNTPYRRTVRNMQKLTQVHENELNYLSAAAGYMRGKQLGLYGKDLANFMSDMISKTQSDYGNYVRAPLLRSNLSLLYPFQSFKFEKLGTWTETMGNQEAMGTTVKSKAGIAGRMIFWAAATNLLQEAAGHNPKETIGSNVPIMLELLGWDQTMSFKRVDETDAGEKYPTSMAWSWPHPEEPDYHSRGGGYSSEFLPERFIDDIQGAEDWEDLLKTLQGYSLPLGGAEGRRAWIATERLTKGEIGVDEFLRYLLLGPQARPQWGMGPRKPEPGAKK